MNILRTFVAMISVVTYTHSAMQNAPEDIGTMPLMQLVLTKPKDLRSFNIQIQELLRCKADPNIFRILKTAIQL